MSKPLSPARPVRGLRKSPTGIRGLDEIVGGGFPQGRATLVCGPAGCGKTLLAAEFLARGASERGEPGVFVTFEESAPSLLENLGTMEFGFNGQVRKGRIFIDEVRVSPAQVREAGAYNLDGLFARIDYAVRAVGAKRLVLDTLETLFSGFGKDSLLRLELQRLFAWIREKGLTAVVTAEAGKEGYTRRGLEEFVSDCVIHLDNRMREQVSTRRLRVVKYRGSSHGSNEYPFLIDGAGLSVLPITSLQLGSTALGQRVTTGIPDLDEMMGGRGYFRGSTVLVSGAAGTGKSSLAAHFLDAACGRGERSLGLCFEESASQVVRNMSSIGIDLNRWIRRGKLLLLASRPSSLGLETHLVDIYREVERFKPRSVVLDPVTNFEPQGSFLDVKAMLTRLADFLKNRGVTGFLTSLSSDPEKFEQSQAGVSSLIDTWILLRNQEREGACRRSLLILKSRGMRHSNEVRGFKLTEKGMCLEGRDAGGPSGGEA